MKTRILAIAAIVLLAAGAGGCTAKYDVFLTPKEGGASAHGQMTFSSGERKMNISVDGKYYSGNALCSLRDHALFKLGYYKCTAQMNSGGDTMICEFELSAHGAGSGDCKNSAGKTYAVQVAP